MHLTSSAALTWIHDHEWNGQWGAAVAQEAELRAWDDPEGGVGWGWERVKRVGRCVHAQLVHDAGQQKRTCCKAILFQLKIKMHIITHTKSSGKPKHSSAPTIRLLRRKQNHRECKRWMVWKPFHTHWGRNEGWLGVNRGFLGQKNPTM